MTQVELNLWWSSLSVSQKEYIATKIVQKNNPDAGKILYPACTEIWVQLSNEIKDKIHDHCIKNHGLIMDDWSEGLTA